MSISKKIENLIDRLRGTTNSMQSECEELGLDPVDDKVCLSVDEAIFECHECGWWCDQSEEASEFVDDVEEWTCRQCCMDNHDWDGEE